MGTGPDDVHQCGRFEREHAHWLLPLAVPQRMDTQRYAGAVCVAAKQLLNLLLATELKVDPHDGLSPRAWSRSGPAHIASTQQVGTMDREWAGRLNCQT